MPSDDDETDEEEGEEVYPGLSYNEMMLVEANPILQEIDRMREEQKVPNYRPSEADL